MSRVIKYVTRVKSVGVLAVVLFSGLGFEVVAVGAQDEPTHDGKSVSYWVSQLGEPEPQAREARLALTKLGAATTIDYLVSALGQKEASQMMRAEAASFISSLARESPAATMPAVPKLASLLPDPDASVRLRAALVLTAFGTNSASAVPVICRMLETEPHLVHDAMLVVLERCGPAAKTALPALQRCLTNSDTGLQIITARTLWVLDKSQADTVRPVAKRCLGEVDDGVRIEAASLLWRMDKNTQEVVPALAALLSGPETRYEYRAIKLLGQIGPPAREAIPALKEWLKSTRTREAFITRAAGEALQSIGATP